VQKFGPFYKKRRLCGLKDAIHVYPVRGARSRRIIPGNAGGIPGKNCWNRKCAGNCQKHFNRLEDVMKFLENSRKNIQNDKKEHAENILLENL